MPTRQDPEPFVPADFSPPARLDHAAFRLRPLGPEHNERDHVAWMGSIDHIRATPGYPDGRWPRPMSLEQNLADLHRHHDHFRDRVGFTYTVLEADGPADRAWTEHEERRANRFLVGPRGETQASPVMMKTG